MKFRIEKNTVKFRLSPLEIELLSSNKSLSESIKISGLNNFEYSILVVEDSDKSSLEFGGSTATARIPQSDSSKWQKSDQIGLNEIINTSGSEIVSLIHRRRFTST